MNTDSAVVAAAKIMDSADGGMLSPEEIAKSKRRTLISLVEERDRLTEETGHYYGVTSLSLKDSDPIRYERFYSRLHASLIAAYEVSRYVAASPGAREMGEILWALLTPEGDALVISPGFFSHVNSGRVAVRFMAEHLYDENPGIRDGDVFVTDDGDSGGAPHPGDTYTYVPIIREDTLLGWAMAINHIMEAGAPVAGSWPEYGVDTFWDGFVFPPIKTGENLQQFTWWEQMWLRRTRAGAMNNLDDKMRLSGCALLHREVHRIVEEIGIDYYVRATREIIEETSRVVRDNIRNTSVPGRYDGVGFRAVKYKGLMPLAHHADKDLMIHVRQRLTIDGDGSLVANMDGSSHWDYHAFNGYPGGADVAFYLGMVNCFGYNTYPTTGVSIPCRAKYPKGSVYNPGNIIASFSNIWGQSMVMNSLGFNAVTRSFYARGFLEEALVADSDWEGIQGEGVLPDGTNYGMTNFEGVGGVAQGAMCFRDGLPLGWAQWTQLPNVGNAEEFEYLIPNMMYLGRGLIPGFCGHGKFRGGVGQGSLHWVVRPSRLTLSRAGAGTAYTTFVAQGMSGGYPSPNAVTISARGTNSKELVERGVPLPRDGLELVKMAADKTLVVRELETWRFEMPPTEFAHGDLLATHNGASSGWGDPLEREPESALIDVQEGWVDSDFAARLYGVVLRSSGDILVVDKEATRERRAEVRRERLGQSVSARDFWKQERQLLVDGDFIEAVRYTYANTVSEEFDFDKDLREFWQLPATFTWAQGEAI